MGKDLSTIQMIKSIYIRCCFNKTTSIIRDLHHQGHVLFSLLHLERRHRSLKSYLFHESYWTKPTSTTSILPQQQNITYHLLHCHGYVSPLMTCFTVFSSHYFVWFMYYFVLCWEYLLWCYYMKNINCTCTLKYMCMWQQTVLDLSQEDVLYHYL